MGGVQAGGWSHTISHAGSLVNNKLIITIMCFLATCQHSAKCILGINSLNLHDDPAKQNLPWGCEVRSNGLQVAEG